MTDSKTTAPETLARTADAWWDWHDADYSRHSATMEEAEERCRAWVAGESDEGPEPAPTVALVETMPEQHRESHRAARNWGTYPANGAVREWMEIDEAEQAVEDDEDGYTKIVETLTREEVIDMLRRGDSGLYESADDEGLVQLTEDGATLVRAAGLTVDADAYGCAFCREQTIEI